MELSGGIAGYVLENDTAEVLVRKLNETAKHYNESSDVTAMWDALQSNVSNCHVVCFF